MPSRVVGGCVCCAEKEKKFSSDVKAKIGDFRFRLGGGGGKPALQRC